MSEKPISPLRRRMIEDMTVRNFVEKTHNDYIRHVRTFICAQERTCIQRHGGTKSNTRHRSVQQIIIESKAPKILKSPSGNLGNFRPQ